MKIDSSSVSNVGPRAVNEDFLAYWQNDYDQFLACIADGLGGMGGGDAASKLAVNSFKTNLTKGAVNSDRMLSAARLAHEKIVEAQRSGPANSMATTLTAVTLSDNKLWGVHCGDSRAVIARGKGIKRLTKDHSEGQRLFDAGKLTKEELARYPRKHILESALGGRDIPIIESFQFDLQAGDKIILTTDGVHNLISMREMQSWAEASASPVKLLDFLVEGIIARGATDNYSVVALFVE